MSDQKVQWIRERPYLCDRPYNKFDFRIHHNGFNVSCCCNLDIEFSKTNGSTDLVKEVRDAIEQKQTHPACWKCSNEDARGHVSERVFNLMGYTLDQLKEFEKTKVDDSWIEISVKLSNLCNLACRSCDSHESTTYEKITKLALRDTPKNLDDMPDLWKQILDEIQAQHLTNKNIILHPIGGETFIQSGFYKLLDWAIEQGIAKDFKLRVTTSFATPISDELQEKFLKFKTVELLASIDSVGENYHYVRWPAKFEKVERNLDILNKLYLRAPDKFPVTGIMPIFSLNNIFYLEEILDFWTQWIGVYQAPIHFNTTHLFRPAFLAVDILPEPYRRHLLDALIRCQSHIFFKQRITTSSVGEYLKSTIDILNSHGSADEEMFQHYLKFTADYDRRTKLDAFHGNRRLFELLSPEHVEIYKNQYQISNPDHPIYFIYDNKRKI